MIARAAFARNMAALTVATRTARPVSAAPLREGNAGFSPRPRDSAGTENSPLTLSPYVHDNLAMIATPVPFG